MCFVSTKSKRKHKFKRSLVCSMALEDKENKDDGIPSSMPPLGSCRKLLWFPP